MKITEKGEASNKKLACKSHAQSSLRDFFFTLIYNYWSELWDFTGNRVGGSTVQQKAMRHKKIKAEAMVREKKTLDWVRLAKLV